MKIKILEQRKITYHELTCNISVNPNKETFMAFGSKAQYRNKLPLWMQTLIDTKSVDAWKEDSDTRSDAEYSSSSKGTYQFCN